MTSTALVSNDFYDISNIQLNTKKEQAHSGEVSCVALFDNSTLVTGGRDGYVHLYNDYLRTTHPTATFQTSDRSPVTALIILDDDNIFVGTSGGTLDRIRIGNGTCQMFYQRTNASVLSICAMNDESSLVVSTVRELIVFNYKQKKM